jgi:hypothetical protein
MSDDCTRQKVGEVKNFQIKFQLQIIDRHLRKLGDGERPNHRGRLSTLTGLTFCSLYSLLE